MLGRTAQPPAPAHSPRKSGLTERDEPGGVWALGSCHCVPQRSSSLICCCSVTVGPGRTPLLRSSRCSRLRRVSALESPSANTAANPCKPTGGARSSCRRPRWLCSLRARGAAASTPLDQPRSETGHPACSVPVRSLHIWIGHPREAVEVPVGGLHRFEAAHARGGTSR